MKPILFNTEMVRTILGGRKTVTRRAVKPQPKNALALCDDGWPYRETQPIAPGVQTYVVYRPPYRPGDILYVRETWTKDGDVYRYKAGFYDQNMRWCPSIHMPREAARIFLRVTGVRVERLREITELDILEKEGITVGFPQPKPSYVSLAYTETRLKPAVRKAFADLWDSTIKPADRARYSWEANPWVWVIEFERCGKPGTMCRA